MAVAMGCGSSASPEAGGNDAAVPADTAPATTYRDPLVHRGSIATTGGIEILESLALADGKLVFCTNLQGLQIADASDPAAMRTIAALRSSTTGAKERPGCQHVAFDGELVYATNRGSEYHPAPYIAAFDLKRSPPAQVAVFTDSARSFEGIAAASGKIFVAEHDRGISVYERQGAAFVTLGNLNDAKLMNATGVALRGTLLYVADPRSGIAVVDVSNPAAPKLTGHVATPGAPQSIVVDGTHAYVAASSAGLVVVDIADPAAPRVVANAGTPGTATQLAYAKGYVYLADWNDVRVFDVHDPGKPRLVTTERPPTSGNFARVLGVAARDGHAFIGEWTGMHGYTLDATATAPDISLSLPSIEIGTTAAGSSTTASLEIHNDGNEPLVVRSIEVAAAGFSVADRSLTIAPGAKHDLVVQFASAGTPAVGTVTLNTDDPDEPSVLVRVAANRPGIGVGDPAPSVEVDVLAATPFKLADARGSVVLLAYFATF